MTVSLPARNYMKALSRLSPYTQFPEHDGVKAVIEAIKSLPSEHKAQAVNLYGDHRVGKSILSYALYENLVRHRDPRECVAYFAFDTRDHRRQRVSVMLIKLIRQLLANEPYLIDKFLDPGSDDRMHWTEGNLWIQLRSIIRQMRSLYIYIVIDSINDCDTDNKPGFFRDLSDLRFAAPGRLNIWCTSIKVPELSTNGFHSVDVAQMPEFKAYWDAFQSQLTDVLASESPKLMAAKDSIRQCLAVSEGFFHASLIASRIRGISSLSRLSLVTADLVELKKGCKDTITDMVQGVPPWAADAVSWMMFAHRPLKPTELAVAVALIEASPGLEPLAGLDKCNIPLDIEGDIKRQLGPLVSTERGEIGIAHSYVAEVLKAWIQSIKKDEALKLRIPRLLLEYLHQCLRKIVEDKIVPIEDNIVPIDPEFSLFEYALEYWHIHYRQVMDDVVRPETEADTWSNKLEGLARTLFDKPEYMNWLASWKYLNLEPQNIGEGVTTEVSKSLLRPVLLTARLGLFGIFKQLFDPASQDDRLAALKIACQNGHPKIVQYLIEATDNSSVIEDLLSEACQRGNEDVVLALIGGRKEIPTHLLTNVCSIGHRSLAERLIDNGAKVDAYGRPSDTPPLHAAIKQGHLDVVNLLLEKGADVNCLDQRGWTPLQCSISRGYSHISDRLLKATGLTDNLNKDNLTSAHLAARLGDVSLLEKVIDLNKSETGEGKERIFSQPLHEAAANGHLEAVKFLLERDAPIDELDSEGKTALFIALSKNHAQVVKHLFEHGAKVATGVKYSESALRQAILHANLDATATILQKDENPNGVDCTDSSPLTDAAREDLLDIFEALIDAGADVNQRVDHHAAEKILDEDITSGWAAVHFAAYYGSTRVISRLVDLEPTIVDVRIDSGHTPLHLAVFCEKIEISEILLSHGTPTDASAGGRKGSLSNNTNSNTTGPGTAVQRTGANVNAVSKKARTPLHIAATNANSDLIKLLLKSRAYANASDDDGKTPLHLAVTSTPNSNFKEIMSALLSSNADPAARDMDGETPLHYAAQNGKSGAVALLLQAGSPVAPVNDAGFTPLYIAAQMGHDKVVAKLLDSDADADTANKKGYTVLHVSAFEGHVEVVDTLLKGGANPDALDDRRDTPLHEAARRGHKYVVERLIKHRASLNVVNLSQITPLQRAVLNSWTFTVKLLLEAGADPNIRDEDGDTALTAAMFKGVKDVLDILLKQDEQGKLKFDIDLDYKNRYGKTPLMHAVQMPWAIKALLDAGADTAICDNNKQTIFHQLASGLPEYQVKEFVEPLLLHPNSKAKDLLQRVDIEGITPIHLAAREGNSSLIEAFYKYSANSITSKDYQGRTAMHHAVRTLSKESLKKTFGEFLRPDKNNHVNIPDADGWTPLHWACRKSREGVMEMLLSQYKYPIRALRYEGRYGWSAMAIALFYKNDDIVKYVESGVMAIDPEWNAFEAKSPSSLPAPQTSAEEALQGCNDGATFSAPLSRPSERWSIAVRNGLRSDGKRVIPGASHRGVYCDDCQNVSVLRHTNTRTLNFNTYGILVHIWRPLQMPDSCRF